MAVEIIGGLWSGSLSLLADAGHMLSDAAALGLSLIAARLAVRPRTPEKTFGWRRFEILAALINGAALWAVSAIVALEAVKRLGEPRPVLGGPMLGVAAAGLMANAAAAVALHGGRTRSLNLKGAYLHVLADAMGSLSVLLAALIIRLTGWLPADPLAGALIAVLIVFSSWRLIQESFQILMEGAPGHLRSDDMVASLASIPDVVKVHDFHVWTVSPGWISLSVHLVVVRTADSASILSEAQTRLFERFGIEHATIQIESADNPACSTETCGNAEPSEPST